jgi:selenocysteine-specific elongation factor
MPAAGSTSRTRSTGNPAAPRGLREVRKGPLAAVLALPVVGWHVDPDAVLGLRRQPARAVDAPRTSQPLEPGPPLDSVRRALGLPDAHGRTVRDRRRRVLSRGEDRPPDGDARRAGRRPRPCDQSGHGPGRTGSSSSPWARATRRCGLVRASCCALLRASCFAGVDSQAARILAKLPQPFTVADAHSALGTHTMGRRSPSLAARPSGRDTQTGGRRSEVISAPD